MNNCIACLHAGRTRLLFRAMDSDHDKLITRTDAEQSVKLLNERLPGVSLDQFASFIQTGDKVRSAC